MECMLLYFLPTIVAACRRNDNVLAVFLVNFFLGWTGIGWIVALVMSLRHSPVHYTYPAGYYTPYPYRRY